MAKHHPDLIMCRKQPGVGIKVLVCGFYLLLIFFYFQLLVDFVKNVSYIYI